MTLSSSVLRTVMHYLYCTCSKCVYDGSTRGYSCVYVCNGDQRST